MSDWQYIKTFMLRWIIFVGVTLIVALMASKSKADIPYVRVQLTDDYTVTFRDTKLCESCHRTYSHCVVSVLLETLPPDADALKHIDTCKVIEAKCTKEAVCANRE